jgi:glycosyltransferase involved in cell wall biosynthesis
MGNKIKIGQFVSFGVGGADKCALNLVKGLLSFDDVDLTVFYNNYSHPRDDEQHSNPTRFNEYQTLPIKMVNIDDVSELNNYGLDILNTHRSGNDNWFLPNFENTHFNFKVVETNFHGYNQTKSDYRIYPSNALLAKLQPCNIPYSVIPNPIYRPINNENLRNELGIFDKFVYGRIARPDANIYSDINLKAYQKIQNENTCFLYVAPNHRAIEDSKKLGLTNVIFLDPTSDEEKISKIYNTFDVLCHSNSLGETFGNTIAEAMIYGKPVITHIGSPSWSQAHIELVGDMTELFITDDIINKYSELMICFKDDKNFYSDTSKYLKNRADNLYDYVNVAKEYLKLYKKILCV